MKYSWEDPQIPTWIKWIVTNENGEVLGFINKPILDKCSLGWESINKNHNPIKINSKSYKGSWEDSLEQRPVV